MPCLPRATNLALSFTPPSRTTRGDGRQTEILVGAARNAVNLNMQCRVDLVLYNLVVCVVCSSRHPAEKDPQASGTPLVCKCRSILISSDLSELA